MARVAAGPSVVSRTMARPSARQVHPPTAWTMRAAISVSISGASAQAMLASVNSVIPASRGRRRPMASDSGPITSCAIAKEPR